MRPALLALVLSAAFVSAATPCTQSGSSPGAQSSSSQPAGKRGKYADHIILSGTVFDERGFLVPKAQVEVRRTGEKKVVARDVSNRGGEFWMHVPGGVEYEMTVKAERFQPQTLKIESGTGDRQDLVFRVKRVTGEKKK